MTFTNDLPTSRRNVFENDTCGTPPASSTGSDASVAAEWNSPR